MWVHKHKNYGSVINVDLYSVKYTYCHGHLSIPRFCKLIILDIFFLDIFFLDIP